MCTCRDDIYNVEAQLELSHRDQYHGLLAHARAEKMMLGETPTKLALRSEKKYARGNATVKIESEGVSYKCQASIERCFCNYYDKLFA